MTEHDRIREKRALDYKAAQFTTVEEELEALGDAIRGLQSTDDPSLNSLHDDLMEQYLLLRIKKEKEERERNGAPTDEEYRAAEQRFQEAEEKARGWFFSDGRPVDVWVVICTQCETCGKNPDFLTCPRCGGRRIPTIDYLRQKAETP